MKKIILFAFLSLLFKYSKCQTISFDDLIYMLSSTPSQTELLLANKNAHWSIINTIPKSNGLEEKQYEIPRGDETIYAGGGFFDKNGILHKSVTYMTTNDKFISYFFREMTNKGLQQKKSDKGDDEDSYSMYNSEYDVQLIISKHNGNYHSLMLVKRN